MRAEINEVEKRGIKTDKRLFCENNKIECWWYWLKKREREKPQIWNVRNEKRITTDPTATKKPTNK